MRMLRYAIGGGAALALAVGLIVGPAEGATIRFVGDGFISTINGAIALAGAGDTIVVLAENGDPSSTPDVYLECVIVTKKVNLVAAGDVTIHCQNPDHGA